MRVQKFFLHGKIRSSSDKAERPRVDSFACLIFASKIRTEQVIFHTHLDTLGAGLEESPCLESNPDLQQ